MEDITQLLQREIDQASTVQGTVITSPGAYQIGALFLKSNVHLIVSEDTILYGSQELADYPEVDNRVAGINMKWPAAMINVFHAENVMISGKGKLDGRGEIWWQTFWGTDEASGMMADYAKKGLRWAADYDCKRPRNILVYESQQVTIKDISSVQSGFWNTQITYSHHILIDGITIDNGKGPSTDGIDIDSCEEVTIQNAHISCNDDNISIKAGRGAEAIAQQRSCRKITIKDCQLGYGSGIAIGSETSGGIEDITIQKVVFEQTGAGFRIKSANNRGGFIRKVTASDLTMKDVGFPFLLQTNWYPDYSYPELPADYEEEIPDYWHKLMAQPAIPVGPAKVCDITIENVQATKTGQQSVRAFFIEASPAEPIRNLTLKNLSIHADEFGKIAGVENLKMVETIVTALAPTLDQNDVYER